MVHIRLNIVDIRIRIKQIYLSQIIRVLYPYLKYDFL